MLGTSVATGTVTGADGDQDIRRVRIGDERKHEVKPKARYETMARNVRFADHAPAAHDFENDGADRGRLAVEGVAQKRSSSFRLSELARRSSVHVGSAVMIMGGWAAIANRAHGVTAALAAALAQGAASALVTFSLKTSLERMSRSLQGTVAFLVPPTVSCAVVFVVLVVVHRVAGTRELWSTISIPYAASFTYGWIYTALLVRRRSRSSPSTGRCPTTPVAVERRP